MSDAIRILVVDDHHVVRQGLVALLNIMPDVAVVGEAADGLEAIELHRALRPDITLMDLQLPKLGGVDAITKIRAETPAARFIVLTTFDGDEDIYRSLQAGAKAYLLKGMTTEELLETIRAVHAGRKRISPEVAADLAEHAGESGLTEREMEVLRLIAAGNANKEIAAQLSIAEETVKRHVTGILAKLGANDRTHAVTIGLKRGIIEL